MFLGHTETHGSGELQPCSVMCDVMNLVLVQYHNCTEHLRQTGGYAACIIDEGTVCSTTKARAIGVATLRRICGVVQMLTSRACCSQAAKLSAAARVPAYSDVINVD